MRTHYLQHYLNGVGKRPWKVSRYSTCRYTTCGFMKDLDPHKVQGTDGISSCVLEECTETLDTPLEVLLKNWLEEGLGSKALGDKRFVFILSEEQLGRLISNRVCELPERLTRK